MTGLVSYQAQYLVPREHFTVGLAYILQPNELGYTGNGAIALTSDALWVCTPDQEHDIIPLQNIRKLDVKDFRGITFDRQFGGIKKYVNPRDAWGVVVEHERIGNFVYTFSFLTFFASASYDWQRKIQQAIGSNDAGIYGLEG